jgi:protein SCO1
VLLGVLAVVGIGRHHTSLPATETKIFQVRGRVLGLNAAEKSIRIAHEEIPNYMPAMTMPLPVKDPALLGQVAPGDSVQFELRVTADDSWIAHIEKIPSEESVSQVAPATSPTMEELEAGQLRAGELVPDFSLVNQEGQAIHLKDFKGKAVLLTFVYTRCPLPNFCPLMSKNFAELQQRLSKEFPGKYHLLSVSMDPEFDRPEVLKEYAERYEANPADWTFATGDSASIHFVADLMGLYFQRENGLISHDLRTALIGPDGRLVHLWKSNVWTPYEVQRRVRETLTGSQDIVAR